MKKVMRIVSTFLLAALLLLTGCTSSSAPKLTATDILTKSYDAMQAAKSFHFELTHSTGGTSVGSGITMTKAAGDIATPDKLSAKITGSLMGATVDVTLISVGGKAMMSNPLSGKMETVPDTFKVLSVFDPGKGIAAIVKGMTNASLEAEEKVGDVLCYHLKGDISKPALAPITGTTAKDGTVAAEVWIAKDTTLVQQVKITGKLSESEKDGIVRTLALSAYNKDVSIILPQ